MDAKSFSQMPGLSGNVAWSFVNTVSNSLTSIYKVIVGKITQIWNVHFQTQVLVLPNLVMTYFTNCFLQIGGLLLLFDSFRFCFWWLFLCTMGGSIFSISLWFMAFVNERVINGGRFLNWGWKDMDWYFWRKTTLDTYWVTDHSG